MLVPALREALASDSTGLLLVDIDWMSEFNRRSGYVAGDVLIERVGQEVRAAAPAEARCVRPRGDVFAVVLRGVGEAETAEFAERFRARIERTCLQLEDGTPLPPATVSVGVAAHVRDERDPEGAAHALLRAADNALHSIKSGGKNRVGRASAELWPAEREAYLATIA